ncbi:alpha/beta fold hydrolase [Aliamphritea hakodatensis]|uniref:alpha/beta fold hydrolase n=1 Tax=Aliamphritea hakodatensis TaxID=2895352 RepID=UPI0022FD497D|nr:alpha/beta hydrolase [Aliamphritea hakodatensis]
MTLKTLQRSDSANGLAFHRSGSGDPVVLIHGVGLRAEAWFQQLPALTRDHEVFAVDMPGHGDSALLNGTAPSLTAYVDHIAGWLETNLSGPAMVLGHSMGAMIAVQLAARYPTLCKGVVALNAVYRRSDAARSAVQNRARQMWEHPEQDRVSAPIERWFDLSGDDHEIAMANLCASWLEAAPAEGYATAYTIFSEEDGPSDAELDSLTVPAWFITGDGDQNSSPEMSRQMAARCRFGHAEVIENSRHMLQLTHPDAINALLEQFISSCKQPSGVHHE